MRYINKRSLLLIITILLVCTFGVSYAAFRHYETGKQQQLLTGEIYLKFKDNTSSLSLPNMYPLTKEEARKRTDNVITFTIDGTSTVTNKDVYYEIYLNEGEEKTGKTRFNPEHIVFDLIEIDENNNKKTLIDALSFKDFNKRKIWVDTVDRNSSINKTYELRMWLSEDVIISDTEDNASYTTSDFENRYLSIKVGVFGDFTEKESPYILTNMIKDSLAANLTTQDTDCNQYVYGQVENNYVWYSGKLWRIVSINNCDGTIKLVTQGNMTTIAWSLPIVAEDGTETYSIDYSTSQIRSWLNNEFLPTLENRATLLADAVWDYTLYSSATATKEPPTNTVPDKVGLLTIYDYYKVRNGSSTNYLNNGYHWWTMSPLSSSNVWGINNNGGTHSSNSTGGSGARPSVNLKSGIIISGGTGEKTKPYTIKGDKETGATSELLSNRISGEYINFNNTKYRIVGIETIDDQQLTKVTMADYDDNKKNVLTTSQMFGNSYSDVNYNTSTGIGKYMYDWYNGTSINSTYKSMIATDGIEWYTGPDDGTGYDYTLSKSGTTVATPIGLGYYGEMFASQFGAGFGSSTTTWLMTKYSGSYVWLVSGSGNTYLRRPNDSNGVRPSFYLKSDVKITDGTGMPHDPYEISQ